MTTSHDGPGVTPTCGPHALVRAQDEAEAAGGTWDDVTSTVRTAADAYPAPVLSTLIRSGCADQAQAFIGVMPTAINNVTSFGRYIIEDVRAVARDIEIAGTNDET